jgi:membrane-bound serine protease (ClpP class)
MFRRRIVRGFARRFVLSGGLALSVALAAPLVSVTLMAVGGGQGGARPGGGEGSAAGSAAAAAAPVVYVAQVDNIIHPITAEFFSDALDAADANHAEAIIFTLETPGGLVESTRTIITRMLAAQTPIVVYVGPGAARAASAGFLITIAADVAVMSPAAHIGAAHPVSGTGENVGETMQQKMASDVAAYARSLATARKRNVSLAEEAVVKSRAFTADEALKASPPLIDFIARDLDDLLKQLEGRSITRFDGRPVTLHTANARTEHLEMTARQRFLSALAHPQIAYVLFTLGLLGLTVELWNPGSILPGVAGGLCLLLAFLAFQVLPINTTGLLLIIFGLFLLILEIKIPSFGVLGVGGALSLMLGSLIMMNRSEDIRVSLQVIAPAMLALAGIFLFLGRLALNAQRLPSVTGVNEMIGATAHAIMPIPPGGTGRVSVHGEIWNAFWNGTGAPQSAAIAEGEDVRIVGLEGLTLIVEPATPAASRGPVT